MRTPTVSDCSEELLSKLTIAIPIYNAETYLAGAITSCLHQAGHIVLYDNCSTDKTNIICEEFALKHPHVSYVRHDTNIGAFQNFKRGLFDCKTEYFQWFGSHDIMGDGFTLPLLNALEKNSDISIASGNIVFINESGRAIRKETGLNYSSRDLMHDSPLVRMLARTKDFRACTIIYHVLRTSHARRAWDDQPCLAFDDVFLLRMAAQGKFFYTPKVVFYARDLSASRNGDNVDRQKKDMSGSAKIVIPPDLVIMNKKMIETVISNVHDKQDIKIAHRIFNAIYYRYHESRIHRRIRRWNRRVSIFSVIILVSIAAYYVYNAYLLK